MFDFNDGESKCEVDTLVEAEQQRKAATASNMTRNLFEYDCNDDEEYMFLVNQFEEQQRSSIAASNTSTIESKSPEDDETEIFRGLRIYCGNNEAKFKSNGQRDAVLAAKEAKQDGVFILPTGAGKSLTFFIPALTSPNEVNIVVIPLRALLIDMIERAKERGINCVEWKPKDNGTFCNLVFVSVENASDNIFRGYLQKNKGCIKRIFMDEAHLYLTSKYRLDMDKLRTIGEIKVPIYLLTATLPPKYMPALLDFFSMEKSRTVIVRSATNRPELSFVVKNCRDGDPVEYISEALDDFVQKNANEKAIIFCRTINDCDIVLNKLNPSIKSVRITGQLKVNEKAQALKTFRNESNVAVTTSSCNCGLDVDNITLVMHYRMPYSLLDWSQQCGRGGRRSQNTKCILFSCDQDIHSVATQIGRRG